jgi:hypothetical protein
MTIRKIIRKVQGVPLSFGLARKSSRAMPADASSLCHEAAVLGEALKSILCVSPKYTVYKTPSPYFAVDDTYNYTVL